MGVFTKDQYNIEPLVMRRFREGGFGRVYYCIHPVIEVLLFFPWY